MPAFPTREVIPWLVDGGTAKELGEYKPHDEQREQRRQNTPDHAKNCTFILLFKIPGNQFLKEELVAKQFLERAPIPIFLHDALPYAEKPIRRPQQHQQGGKKSCHSNPSRPQGLSQARCREGEADSAAAGTVCINCIAHPICLDYCNSLPLIAPKGNFDLISLKKFIGNGIGSIGA